MPFHDPTLPLIFIHVPKTAGVSVREIVKKWYGPGFIQHYFDNITALPPKRDSRVETHTPGAPICVYGHFNQLRGFGMEDNYPEARQCVTVLRDPFEMMISEYYFLRRVSSGWNDRSQVPKGTLASHLESAQPNMLNHFPRPVTSCNYRDIIDEFFVEIGFCEELVPSLHRMAAKLGKPFNPRDLGRYNVTKRDTENEQVQHMRDDFRERNKLEFAVYDYAWSRFATANKKTHDI